MGVNKSITIEGAIFRFEVKSKDGCLHVTLSSDSGEEARVIMTADESKEVVEALDIVRGWVKPMQGRPYTEQELKF